MIELEILEFSKKGHGLAHYNDKKVEVVGALPKEKVLAKWLTQRGKKKKALLQTVQAASPHRVQARCAHALECGGCSFQALEYGEQLKHKQKGIETLFDRKAKPIIQCEIPFYGRNKMEFSFSQNKAGEKFLGLILAGSKGYVFNLKECHLVNSWMAEGLSRFRQLWESSNWSAFHGPSDTGLLRTLTMREGFDQKMIILTVASREEPLLELKKGLMEAFRDCSIIIRKQITKKGEPTRFSEEVLSGSNFIQEKLTLRDRTLLFNMGPSAFFQPQPRQAEKLYEAALQFLEPASDETLLDLYSGTGTMSLLFARFYRNVIGIELNPESVKNANHNRELNQITNVAFLEGDAGKILEKISDIDALIVDPPREGLRKEAIDQILRLNPKKIVYISCNPRTQKQDIEQLLLKYTLIELQPLDQFPHSPHIENIALLTLDL